MKKEDQAQTIGFQQDYFKQCAAKFSQAQSNTMPVKKYYRIAETTVCLNFAGNALVQELTQALTHIEIDELRRVDFTINVWDTQSTKVKMLDPPCKWSAFTDRGDIWGSKISRFKMAFHWSEYSFNIMDCEKKEAFYWVNSNDSFPYWVTSSPFRSLFNWWLELNEGQLLHAAAVGTEHGAVLITGKGGMGKSSTALKGLEDGMYYLADDYLIVKNAKNPFVYSLYNSAKLVAKDIGQYPKLKPLLSNFIEENQEKGVFFLYPELKNQIIMSQPVVAIVTPNIVGEELSFFSEYGENEMARELAFTSMSQLPYSGVYTHHFVNTLVQNTPCARFNIGRNPDSIKQSLHKVCDHPFESFQIGREHNQNNWPLVSVIIPVYNGEQFVEGALQSVINQDYPAVELIVVDDGSKDSSRSKVDSSPYDVRYFYQPNNGPASARNRGIREVSGEYLAFLDVDDTWPENTLKRLVKFMENEDDVDVVRGYGQLYKTTDDGKHEYIGNPKESFLDYIGAALYKKNVFQTVGLFDEDMQYGEDEDWFNRAKESTIKIERLDEVTLMVFRHENNMTNDKKSVEKSMLRIFKKSLDRKRQRQEAGYKGSDNELPYALVKRKPRLSVVLFVNTRLNQEEIKRYANSSYPDTEILLVGRSANQFGDAVDNTNVHFIQCKGSQEECTNKAIECSTGSFLYFHSNRFEMATESLNNLADVLINNRNLPVVLSHAIIENKPEVVIDPNLGLYRKSTFKQIGFLSQELKSGAWSDWFFRYRELGLPLSFYKRSFVKDYTLPLILVEDLKEAQNLSLVRRKEKGLKKLISFPQKEYGTQVVQFYNQPDD